MFVKQAPEVDSSKEESILRPISLKEVTYHRLSESNLRPVHELFRRNEHFYPLPLENFRRGTLEDESFDPELTLILDHPETGEPIAAFIAVIRKGWVRKNCYIKGCIVDERYRRRGIGSGMLLELKRRARPKLHFLKNGRSVAYPILG